MNVYMVAIVIHTAQGSHVVIPLQYNESETAVQQSAAHLTELLQLMLPELVGHSGLKFGEALAKLGLISMQVVTGRIPVAGALITPPERKLII